MITLKHRSTWATPIGPATWRITKICPVTKQEYSVEVDELSYEQWQGGALIQQVMPQLDNDQREFLISGLTPPEYEALYSADPEA